MSGYLIFFERVSCCLGRIVLVRRKCNLLSCGRARFFRKWAPLHSCKYWNRPPVDEALVPMFLRMLLLPRVAAKLFNIINLLYNKQIMQTSQVLRLAAA